jgi:Ca2+-transporting ATPase
VFVVLGLAQLGVALAVRARPEPGTARNWSLLGAVAVSGVLQVAGVLLPPLQTLLGTESLTATELAACGVAAALPGLALHLARRRSIGRGQAGPEDPARRDLMPCPTRIEVPDDRSRKP